MSAKREQQSTSSSRLEVRPEPLTCKYWHKAQSSKRELNAQLRAAILGKDAIFRVSLDGMLHNLNRVVNAHLKFGETDVARLWLTYENLKQAFAHLEETLQKPTDDYLPTPGDWTTSEEFEEMMKQHFPETDLTELFSDVPPMVTQTAEPSKVDLTAPPPANVMRHVTHVVLYAGNTVLFVNWPAKYAWVDNASKDGTFYFPNTKLKKHHLLLYETAEMAKLGLLGPDPAAAHEPRDLVDISDAARARLRKHTPAIHPALLASKIRTYGGKVRPANYRCKNFFWETGNMLFCIDPYAPIQLSGKGDLTPPM